MFLRLILTCLVHIMGTYNDKHWSQTFIQIPDGIYLSTIKTIEQSEKSVVNNKDTRMMSLTLHMNFQA